MADTLLQNFSDDEIEAVVAHEIGHHIHNDVIRRIAWLGSMMGVGFWFLQFALQAFIGDLRDLQFLPYTFLSMSLMFIYCQVFLIRIIRKQEMKADQYAWTVIPNVGPFISAMQKLASRNLLTYDKSQQWRYSHPAMSERIQAAERYVAANQKSKVVASTG